MIVHADLSPLLTSFPDAVTSGESVLLQWTTRNLGSGATLAGFIDRVYLSQDAILDSGDLVVGSAAQASPLAAGAEIVQSITVEIPLELSGDWYWIVKSRRRRRSL